MKRFLAYGVGVLGLAAILLRPAPTQAQKKPPDFKVPGDGELIKDVAYGRGGDRALTMHLLRPKNAPGDPMPVLVWIHGGGWLVGCGPTDLLRLARAYPEADFLVNKFLGFPIPKEELAHQANPITHVTKNAPPFLIVHGERDRQVPPSQSELLHAALQKAGVTVSLCIGKGQGHDLGGEEVSRTVREFFDRTFRVDSKEKNDSSK